MEIHRLKTEELAEEAAKTLNAKLAEVKDRPTLFLLSGGSALAVLPFLDTELTGTHLTLGTFDDRYSTDPTQNNFELLKQTNFFQKSLSKGSGHLDTSLASDMTLTGFGQQFETALKQWLRDNPEGMVLASMGVGPDGHTGGIMPFPENSDMFEDLFESDLLAVGYNAGVEKNPFPERITVTMSFIKDYLDFAVVYMSGENKKLSLEKILSADGTLAEAPCRILREIPTVEIFTNIKE